jgi:hypothetical protein
MNMTNDQKQRAVTEFAALERELDTVLFRRNDDDDEDYLKTGLKTAGFAGGTVGAGIGVNALRVKGRTLNQMPIAEQITGADASAAVQRQWGGKVGSVIRPNITPRPESRFVLPGMTSTRSGASKGFLGDLATGSKATGKEALAGLSDLWKKIFKTTARAAA